MDRRTFLAAGSGAVVGAAAGCLGSGGLDPSRLDLTVRNDGDGPVDVEVVVEGNDGTTYATESDRIDAGVARAFEAVAGATGRHEVTVTGPDWEGRLAWDADFCGRYDATVAVDAATVEVAGECAAPR